MYDNFYIGRFCGRGAARSTRPGAASYIGEVQSNLSSNEPFVCPLTPSGKHPRNAGGCTSFRSCTGLGTSFLPLYLEINPSFFYAIHEQDTQNKLIHIKNY